MTALAVQQPVDAAQREVRKAVLEYRCVPEGLAMTFLTVGLRAAVDIVCHVAADTVVTCARQLATVVVGVTFATGEQIVNASKVEVLVEVTRAFPA